MTLSLSPRLVAPKLAYGRHTGPNPYVAGGMVFDLRSSFTRIDDLMVVMTTRGTNITAAVDYEYALNTPANGEVTVKIVRMAFALSSIGSVTGQPAGVSVSAVSGALTATEAAHTHDINHDHAAVTSAAAAGGTTTVNTTAGTATIDGHNHSVDLPALGVTASGGGSAHSHAWNNLYRHQHTLSANSSVDSLQLEIGAVNLSDCTWAFLATGVGP